MESAPTFANNFWGRDDAGYGRLVQRMHDSKRTVEEVLSFYSERQAIEADYARRLTALARRGLGTAEVGGLKKSLDTIRATTETMARSHETAARQIGEQLRDPLEAFAGGIRERRKTAEDTMARLSKAKASQNAAVEKARARFENECHKVTGYQAQRNLLVGKELEKNNHKLDRSQFAVDSLQREYQDALRILSETIDSWNREWRLASDRFQDLEEERINFMKSNLWDYANALSAVCVTDDEGCELVRVALEKTEAARDIRAFISLRGTGSKIMDPPAFTNYLSGFSRDDAQGTYKIANFARNAGDASFAAADDDDEADNTLQAATSAASFARSPVSARASTARTSMVVDDEPEPVGHHSVPDLSYERPFRSGIVGGGGSKPNLGASSQPSLRPQASEEYLSSSPGRVTDSPSSSLYSAATTFSNSSPYDASQAKKFAGGAAHALDDDAYLGTSDTTAAVPATVRAEKRKSWAVPFKRQSSPDLSRVWKTVDDADRASIASSLRESHDSRVLRESTSSLGSARRAPAAGSQAGGSQDPLLAALARLKTPPLGSPEPETVGTRGSGARARPQSMPGAAHIDRSAPAAAARSPNRREVGAGAPPREALRDAARGDHQSRPTRPRAKSFVDARGDAQSRQGGLPTHSSDGRSVLRYARAQYDYRAAIPEEVSFRKGDVLLIMAMQDDGWWDAEVFERGRFGLAPSNFLASI